MTNEEITTDITMYLLLLYAKGKKALAKQASRMVLSALEDKDHHHQLAIEEKEREFVEKGMDFLYYKLDQEFKSFDISVKLGEVLQDAKREYAHSKKDEA